MGNNFYGRVSAMGGRINNDDFVICGGYIKFKEYSTGTNHEGRRDKCTFIRHGTTLFKVGLKHPRSHANYVILPNNSLFISGEYFVLQKFLFKF